MTLMDELGYIVDRETRSISPENLSGEKGAGAMAELEDGLARAASRELGKGWKVNPYRVIEPDETMVLAEVSGSGAIKHIWLTSTGTWRKQILRFYWDGSDVPAVECPLCDFFACGWQQYAQINSLAVCVNPGSAFNCYWTMPFKKAFKITLQNLSPEPVTVYYQVTYERKDMPENIAYFHTQFHRVNPLPYKEVYTILDKIEGRGQYVGTYMAWGVNNNGWWGEGEMKFYIDGDTDYPTICGTGTEDYFGGSFNFENAKTQQYQEYTTPYSGLPQVIRPDGIYRSQMRFGMYRWHLTDPIYFKENMKVTIQALGWRDGGRYLPLRDDIASAAYFYLDKPYTTLPKLPTVDELEII